MVRNTREQTFSTSGDADILFSLGEVCAILERIHGIAPSKRPAFEARVKNLIRVGVISGLARGRGKTATYRLGDLIALAVAMELVQLGLSPSRIATALQRHLNNSVSLAIIQAVDPVFEEDTSASLISIRPETLLDLKLGEPSDYPASLTWGTAKQTFDNISTSHHYKGGRLSIVNISTMIEELARGYRDIDRGSVGDFKVALRDWYRSRNDARPREGVHGHDPQA